MTSNLKLPYLAAAQAQKHITHNEALRALDALVQIGVLDRDLTVPPGTPADGDCYIVAAAATGAWAGRDGRLAAWQDGVWMFYAPREGWVAWVADEDALVAWDGAAWVLVVGGVASVNPVALVGVNTTADATNRLAIKSDAVLHSHDDVTPGSGSVQHKLNKAAAAETASFLFQTGYSGRAEIGLAGDDDVHVKVSPDGAAWHEAIVIDRHTGAVSIPRQASPWQGRAWAALGTSITSGGAGYVSCGPGLAALLGASLVNLGVSGGSLATSSVFGPGAISAQIANIPASTNLVTLEVGINDFRGNAALGVLGDTTTATFYGALHAALTAISTADPARVVVLLTPYGNADNFAAGKWNAPNANGVHLRQFQQAIRDVAAIFGAPVIEVGTESGVGSLRAATYTTDLIHLNAAGAARYAAYVHHRLMRLAPSGPEPVTPPLVGFPTTQAATLGDLAVTNATLVSLAGGVNGSVAATVAAGFTYGVLWLASAPHNAVEFETAAGTNLWFIVGQGASGYFGVGDAANVASFFTSGRFGAANTGGPALVNLAVPRVVDPVQLGKRYRLLRTGNLFSAWEFVSGVWSPIFPAFDVTSVAGNAGFRETPRLGILVGSAASIWVKPKAVQIGTAP